MVVPDELDLRLVGVGSGQAEEGALHPPAGQFQQLVGQDDGFRVGCAREDVVVRQLGGLLRDGVDDLLPAVAHVHAVHPRHPIDHRSAMSVRDADARSTLHDALPRHPTRRKVVGSGEGVQKGCAVELLERLDGCHALICHVCH